MLFMTKFKVNVKQDNKVGFIKHFSAHFSTSEFRNRWGDQIVNIFCASRWNICVKNPCLGIWSFIAATSIFIYPFDLVDIELEVMMQSESGQTWMETWVCKNTTVGL